MTGPQLQGETRGQEWSFYCWPLSLVTGGVTKLGLTKFEAKIGQENEPSIRMFQKLHFKQVRASSLGRPRKAELLVLG